jgi:hypothetical protein
MVGPKTFVYDAGVLKPSHSVNCCTILLISMAWCLRREWKCYDKINLLEAIVAAYPCESSVVW